MVKISSIKDINIPALQDCFRTRGHGIENPFFWTYLNKSLNNENVEVHQCKCGDVFILDVNIINQGPKDQNGNVLCKICGNYDGQAIKSRMDRTLQDIIELFYPISLSQSEQENPQIIEKIREIGNGIIPINDLYDIRMGLALLKRYYKKINSIIKNDEPKENFQYNKLFEELFHKVTNFNKIRFYELSIFPDLIEKAQSQNIIYRNYMNELFHLNESEFNPINQLPEYQFQALFKYKSFEERIIELKLQYYKSIYESAVFPDYLMNILLILRNENLLKDPFLNKRITYPNRKPIDIDSLFRKIKYFQQQPELDQNIKDLLEYAYDNKLRNDYAHEQYKIDLEKKIVESTKDKTKRSFEEVNKKFEAITNLEELVYENIMPTELPQDLIDSIDTSKGLFSMEAILDDHNITHIVIYQFHFFNPESKPHKVNLYFGKNLLDITTNRDIHILLSPVSENAVFLKSIVEKNFFITHLNLIIPYGLNYLLFKRMPEIMVDDKKFYLVSSDEYRYNLSPHDRNQLKYLLTIN